MCLCPIHVKNPTRFYQDGVSRTILTVRCGHCAECQKENADDWFVRAFFEYRNIINTGVGRVFFILLTYDEENVPHYYDESSGFDCPCFNPEHIKHFRDSLRTYLKRDGKEYTGIKYKICAEFGGNYGRPHYHCLLFVPYSWASDRDCKDYVRGKWNPSKRCFEGGLIQRAWPYGFVSWSNRHGMTIKSDGGIQYAMKYVNKEDKWTIKYCIPSYLEKLKHSLETATSSDEVEMLRDKIRSFRRILPRHFTSIGFGDDIIDTFRDSNGDFDITRLVEGKIDLTKFGKTPSVKHPGWKYNIPAAIMRKICYNCDDGLWTRNQVGFDVAIRRHQLSKQYTAEKFETYFNYDSAKEHVLSCVGEIYDKRDDYDLKSDVALINKLMRGRCLEDLVMYYKVYSGVPLAYDMDGDCLLSYNERYLHEGMSYNMDDKEHNSYVRLTQGMTDDEMMDFFRHEELSLLMEQLSPTREPDPEHGARCHRKGFTRQRATYGDFSCFKDFDEILLIIGKWEELVGACRQHAADIKDDRTKKILALSSTGWTCEGTLY